LGARWYSYEGASIVTYLGRKTISVSIDKAKDLGLEIIYGDTDSVYFSAWPIMKEEVEQGTAKWGKETCIQVYDTIVDALNETFPLFMETAFHCPRANGEIIRAGREIAATRGLYITI